MTIAHLPPTLRHSIPWKTSGARESRFAIQQRVLEMGESGIDDSLASRGFRDLARCGCGLLNDIPR